MISRNQTSVKRRNMAARLLSAAAVIVMSAVMVIAVPAEANANSTSFDGHCRFDGKKIQSDFKTEEIAKMFGDLQPGDDMTFNVEYTNGYTEDTDWYMKNVVMQTLERVNTAKKRIQGAGTPESGGYTYSITHVDSKGDKTVLFSNDKVGGSNAESGEESTPGNMEGLEQATNALDEYFYIDTVAPKGSGSVSLYVKFEGETEVNDYMDTEGEIDLRFAVELTPDGSGHSDRIKTGDNSRLLLWSAVFIAGSVLLALAALILHRKEKDTASRETGGAE